MSENTNTKTIATESYGHLNAENIVRLPHHFLVKVLEEGAFTEEMREAVRGELARRKAISELWAAKIEALHAKA